MSQPSSRADDALLALARAVQATGYQFVTPTPATHARVNTRPENAWAKDLRGVFGWSRPFRDGVIGADLLRLMQEAEVAERHEDGWRSLVRLSTLSGLQFLHSAYPTDASDSVFFGPDTYRFARAIEAHLERSAPPVRRAVDVGCGAGPGAVLLARALPGAEILAVDINPAALRLTAINAALAGVAVAAMPSDLLAGVDGPVDLVVANPPYLVDPAARSYRHGGGALGADLSLRIAASACDRLAPGGTLLLYTGVAIVNGRDPFRDEAVAQVSSQNVDWAYQEMDPDVFGEELVGGPYRHADRIAAVVLTVSKRR